MEPGLDWRAGLGRHRGILPAGTSTMCFKSHTSKKACLVFWLRAGRDPSFAEGEGTSEFSYSTFCVMAGETEAQRGEVTWPQPLVTEWQNGNQSSGFLTSSPVLFSPHFLNNPLCTWRSLSFRIQPLFRFLCMAGSQEP